jgi:hypothetical protein
VVSVISQPSPRCSRNGAFVRVGQPRWSMSHQAGDWTKDIWTHWDSSAVVSVWILDNVW